MGFPECFVSKCNECDCKDFCARRVVAETEEQTQASKSAREFGRKELAKTRKRKYAKKGSQTKEQLRVKHIETCRAYREKKKAERAAASASSDDNLIGIAERAERLQRKINKTKEEQNHALPERP